MLIPFPYIKTILKERKGRILENLHLMISPDDSRQQALISIYLPKDIRKETIKKVENGVKESRVCWIFNSITFKITNAQQSI